MATARRKQPVHQPNIRVELRLRAARAGVGQTRSQASANTDPARTGQPFPRQANHSLGHRGGRDERAIDRRIPLEDRTERARLK